MTKTITRLKLSELTPNARNPRGKASKEGLKQLVASITHQGLLQPLLVYRDPVTNANIVIDGNRRLEALKKVAGETDPDVAIHMVASEADALELAVTANIVREDMSPQDEYRAFAAMAKEGHKAEAIAARFGVKPLEVEQRMALGRLASPIMAKWESDAIDTDFAMALANIPNQEEQVRLFKSCRSIWELRRIMADKRINVEHCLDVAAYEAAGGKVIEDLFPQHEDDEPEAWCVDTEIFWTVQMQKVEQMKASLLGDGWGLVEILRLKDKIGYNSLPKSAQETSPKATTKKARRGRTAIILIGTDGEVTPRLNITYPEQRKAEEKARMASTKPMSDEERAQGEAHADAADMRQDPTLAKGQVNDLRIVANNNLVASCMTMLDEQLIALAATVLLARISTQPDYGTPVPEMRDPLVKLQEKLRREPEWPVDEQDEGFFYHGHTTDEESRRIYMVLKYNPALAAQLLGALLGALLHRDYTNDQSLLRDQVGLDSGHLPLYGWKVTPAFLEQCPKPYLLALVKQFSGENAAKELASTKRSGLAARLMRDLPEGWVPDGFHQATQDQIDADADKDRAEADACAADEADAAAHDDMEGDADDDDQADAA